MIKITGDLIAGVSQAARKSQRRRSNYNFHSTFNDPIQRLINAIEPGTYIPPHKHENPDKAEVFIILRGKALALEFDDNGKVVEHIVIDAKGGNRGVEFPPRTWHSFIALEGGTALYEVKNGPYAPAGDKNFAPGAPREGADGSIEFNRKILKELGLQDK